MRDCRVLFLSACQQQQARLVRIKSNQIKSNQIKSNQIKSNPPPPFTSSVLTYPPSFFTKCLLHREILQPDATDRRALESAVAGATSNRARTFCSLRAERWLSTQSKNV
jgi:hypothetical protein